MRKVSIIMFSIILVSVFYGSGSTDSNVLAYEEALGDPHSMINVLAYEEALGDPHSMIL